MAKLISAVVLAFFLAAGMPVHGEEAIVIDQPSGDQASGDGGEQQTVKKDKKGKKSKVKKGKKGKKGKKAKAKKNKSKKDKKAKKAKKAKQEKAADAASEDRASEWVQPEGSAQ